MAGEGQYGEEDLNIYLKFRDDSSFTEDDVSKYFSEFGAVQRVMIPNKQKRVFGFVTFANAETVKAILARESPHIICGSDVFVKPYKYNGRPKDLDNMRILTTVADVDRIVNYTSNRLLVLRFGCSSNHVCRRVDDMLMKHAPNLSKLALIAFVDNDSEAGKFFSVQLGIICTPSTVYMYNCMEHLPAERLQNCLRIDRGYSAKEGKMVIRYPILPDESSITKRMVSLSFSDGDKFTNDELQRYFHWDFGRVEKLFIPPVRKRGNIRFVYAETVRHLLAYRDPHVIRGSNVQVEEYTPSKSRRQQQLQQQMERGNVSPCSSPSGMNFRDLFDSHMAPRMFSNTQEMLRRKAEQVDLQQAKEFQRKRFLNLQLPNMENESFHHHQRSLSIGSPSHFPSRNNQSLLFRSENAGEQFIEGNGDSGDNRFHSEINRVFLSDNDHTSSQEQGYSNHVNKGQETSTGYFLPDSLFDSPPKTGETRDPESGKEKGAALAAATTENKSPSPDQSA